MLRLSWAWIVESSKDSKDDRPLGRIKKVPCWYGTTFCPNALNCQAANCPYRYTKLFAKNLFKIYRYIRISFRREFLTVFASGKAKDTVFSLHGHHTFLHKYRNVKKVLYLSFTGNKIRFYFQKQALSAKTIIHNEAWDILLFKNVKNCQGMSINDSQR